MVTLDQLEQMQKHNQGLPPERLADALGITISGSTPEQRLDSLLSQIQNLYSFRVGKTPVHITFLPCESSLKDKLQSYFIGIKTHETT